MSQQRNEAAAAPRPRLRELWPPGGCRASTTPLVWSLGPAQRRAAVAAAARARRGAGCPCPCVGDSNGMKQRECDGSRGAKRAHRPRRSAVRRGGPRGW